MIFKKNLVVKENLIVKENISKITVSSELKENNMADCKKDLNFILKNIADRAHANKNPLKDKKGFEKTVTVVGERSKNISNNFVSNNSIPNISNVKNISNNSILNISNVKNISNNSIPNISNSISNFASSFNKNNVKSKSIWNSKKNAYYFYSKRKFINKNIFDNSDLVVSKFISKNVFRNKNNVKNKNVNNSNNFNKNRNSISSFKHNKNDVKNKNNNNFNNSNIKKNAFSNKNNVKINEDIINSIMKDMKEIIDKKGIVDKSIIKKYYK